MPDGGVAGELYDRHKRSSQPESRQVCAILGAVLEVVSATGMQPTPTTLFGAVMSSLDKEETQASAEVRSSPPSHPRPCMPPPTALSARRRLASHLLTA